MHPPLQDRGFHNLPLTEGSAKREAWCQCIRLALNGCITLENGSEMEK